MDTLRAVIFIFVCLVFSGSAFAGDRFTRDSYSSAVAKCTAQRSNWVEPCVVVGEVCPATQNGGSCSESAKGKFLSADGVSTGYITQSIQYDYCSNAFPTWNGITCVVTDPCAKDSGKALGRESIWMFLETATSGNQVCIDGCTHSAKSVVCAPRFGVKPGTGDVLQVSTGEDCEAQGPFSNKGYKCSSGVPGVGSPYANPPKDYWDNGKGVADCAKSGGSWGSVNGVEKCVKGLTNGTSGKGSGSGVNGTSSTTRSDTKTNADGSTTTTKVTDTTTCKDGVCTTTTVTETTTTTSGGETKTDTKTDTGTKEQNTFCQQNPDHQLCVKNEMSGDCSAGFTCSGDPVQCATAKAAQEMKCTLSGKTDGSTLADQMIAGNDPALQGDNNPLIPKSVTLSSITPSRTLSGACPPPITVTVFGKTASYSFDTVCPWIETLGRILVGLAWLSAFYIIARSIQ